MSATLRPWGKFLADRMTSQALRFHAFGCFRFDSEKRVLVARSASDSPS
jgi:isopentenyldiphosphate isomerase